MSVVSSREVTRSERQASELRSIAKSIRPAFPTAATELEGIATELGTHEHAWSRWLAHSGMPKPTRYRRCIVGDCGETQTEPAPVSPMG